MNIEIKINDDIDRIKWASFVLNHPKGNVFQTPEYYEALKCTENNTPIACAAFIGAEMIGVVLGTIITNYGKIVKWITARSIVMGCPIVVDDNPEILYKLIDVYMSLMPVYVIYSEIRPVYNLDSMDKSLLSMGFRRIGHYNLILDITNTSDALFAAMHKERKRNVRQAENAGLVFREITDKKDREEAVSLIRHTYNRKHVPLSHPSIFDAVYERMNGYIHFFAAWTSEGRMIAAQVRLYYKDLVYAWYAGADDKYFKLRPNDFLMWNVIKYSHDNGFKIFDFGGGGEPGKPYGVRDYKLKYGCECYDYGRFLFMHRPVTYMLASWFYKSLRKIRNGGKE